MRSPGLRELQRTLKSFRELTALALKGVLAAPFLALIAKVGPPPTVAVSAITCIAIFIVILWVFHFWYGLSRTRMNLRMKIALSLGAICLCATGVTTELFVRVRPSTGERIVIGYTPLPPVSRLIQPAYGLNDALQDHQFQPEFVYTKASLAVAHTILVISWLATFTSFGMFIACFVLSHIGKVQQVRELKPRVFKLKPGPL